jgi:acetoin utilization protein AcuB
MSRGVSVVSPATAVEEAAWLMRRRKIGALPVVSAGRLVGIVTVSDILDLVCRELGKGKKPAPSRRPAKAPKKSPRRVR